MAIVGFGQPVGTRLNEVFFASNPFRVRSISSVAAGIRSNGGSASCIRASHFRPRRSRCGQVVSGATAANQYQNFDPEYVDVGCSFGHTRCPPCVWLRRRAWATAGSARGFRPDEPQAKCPVLVDVWPLFASSPLTYAAYWYDCLGHAQYGPRLRAALVPSARRTSGDFEIGLTGRSRTGRRKCRE